MDLLSAFAAENVKYLLIGGYAVSYHARPRYTKDIDLWISNVPDNLQRVYFALQQFGAPQHVLDDLQSLAPDEVLFMGIPPVRVDLLQQVKGVDFADAYERKVVADWAGVPVAVISLQDLISSKLAAGRPQDLLDVEVLQRVETLPELGP